MNAPKDGGPAFPSHGSMGEVANQGMTLRDYFAAKAMQAFIAASGDCLHPMLGESHGRNLDRWVAESSYDYADAMLAKAMLP